MSHGVLAGERFTKGDLLSSDGGRTYMYMQASPHAHTYTDRTHARMPHVRTIRPCVRMRRMHAVVSVGVRTSAASSTDPLTIIHSWCQKPAWALASRVDCKSSTACASVDVRWLANQQPLLLRAQTASRNEEVCTQRSPSALPCVCSPCAPQKATLALTRAPDQSNLKMEGGGGGQASLSSPI
jgi:hypothetical protein